jgi:hypothetical protein
MSAPKLVTCKWCNTPGLIWFRTRTGKWILAKPNDAGQVMPSDVHFCVYKPQRVAQAIERGHKASTWRRGKSPSSYG